MKQRFSRLRLTIILSALITCLLIISAIALIFDLYSRDPFRILLVYLVASTSVIIGSLALTRSLIKPLETIKKSIDAINETAKKTNLYDRSVPILLYEEFFDLAFSVNRLLENMNKGKIFDESQSVLNEYKSIMNSVRSNQQLVISREIQKKFLPLDPVPSGEERKLSTGSLKKERIEFYGFYAGARGVSSDYFNYIQIDEDHYACIKYKISGNDASAVLVMVTIATAFKSYFRNLETRGSEIHVNEIVEEINDLVGQLELKGKFAALVVTVISLKTGQARLSNAGDNILHYFNESKRSMEYRSLSRTPAAGPFSTDIIEIQGGFKQETHVYKTGDILFFFTDGLEESQRHLRNSELEVIKCEGCDFASDPYSNEDRKIYTHLVGMELEELGLTRIYAILNSIINGQNWELIHNHNPYPERKLTFDFKDCKDDIESAVIGLMAVEKIFRMIPDPKAGPEDRILVDRKIDEFLKVHFDQYDEYFQFPVDHPDFAEFVYFTHLKEEAQYDDLTILAVKLNPGESINPETTQFNHEIAIEKLKEEFASDKNIEWIEPVEVETLDNDENIEELISLDEPIDVEDLTEDGDEEIFDLEPIDEE